MQADLTKRAVPGFYICSLMNAKPLACQLYWAFPRCCHEGVSKLFREACCLWQCVNEYKFFFLALALGLLAREYFLLVLLYMEHHFWIRGWKQ